MDNKDGKLFLDLELPFEDGADGELYSNQLDDRKSHFKEVNSKLKDAENNLKKSVKEKFYLEEVNSLVEDDDDFSDEEDDNYEPDYDLVDREWDDDFEPEYDVREDDDISEDLIDALTDFIEEYHLCEEDFKYILFKIAVPGIVELYKGGIINCTENLEEAIPSDLAKVYNRVQQVGDDYPVRYGNIGDNRNRVSVDFLNSEYNEISKEDAIALKNTPEVKNLRVILDGQLVSFDEDGKPIYKAEKKWDSPADPYRKPNGEIVTRSNKLTFNTVINNADKVYLSNEVEPDQEVRAFRSLNPESKYYNLVIKSKPIKGRYYDSLLDKAQELNNHDDALDYRRYSNNIDNYTNKRGTLSNLSKLYPDTVEGMKYYVDLAKVLVNRYNKRLLASIKDLSDLNDTESDAYKSYHSGIPGSYDYDSRVNKYEQRKSLLIDNILEYMDDLKEGNKKLKVLKGHILDLKARDRYEWSQQGYINNYENDLMNNLADKKYIDSEINKASNDLQDVLANGSIRTRALQGEIDEIERQYRKIIDLYNSAMLEINKSRAKVSIEKELSKFDDQEAIDQAQDKLNAVQKKKSDLDVRANELKNRNYRAGKNNWSN